MKLGSVATAALVLTTGATAHAGGLFLPGSGAVSTSRAGAAVASVDDGEALSINPAGLAKTKGTTITLSMAIIDFAMQFQRRGTYDPVEDADFAWEGMPYPSVEDDAKPALGIGGFQPIPIFTISSDLGGVVPNLRVGVGVYAPNSYPFRRTCTKIGGRCVPYSFPQADPNEAPNPARYDIIEQDAVLFTPSVAASYSILPNLDVGARFGFGFAHLQSKIAIWSAPVNVTEDPRKDALFDVDVKDSWVPTWGLGVLYRPTPVIEIGANFSSATSLSAKGSSHAILGELAGAGEDIEVEVAPIPDDSVTCARGGTRERQKACVYLDVPMTAAIGGRYRFLDAAGAERGDIELNLVWENWAAERASDFLVVIDTQLDVTGSNGVTTSLALKDNIVRHGFQDTFGARLGGSWRFPVGDNTLIARGGLAYDTSAAKPGWHRTDLDGAARGTITAGAGYRTSRFEINAGFGAVVNASVDNEGECNPISTINTMQGCNRDGNQRAIEDRQGPDPITPTTPADQQTEAPTNRGTMSGHYIMFMLGATTWF